jgi:hypothetical protein
VVVPRLLVLGVLLSSCSVGDDDPWQPAASVGPQGESSGAGEDHETGDAASSGSTADSGSIDESSTAESDATGEGESTSDTDDEPGAACHPLLQDCAADEVCIFVDEPLPQCAADASGRYGAAGEPCEFANVCDAGLFCAGARSVACPDDVVGCCTPFCDLTAARSPCTAGSCVPYFPDGSPTPDLANLGYCDAV